MWLIAKWLVHLSHKEVYFSKLHKSFIFDTLIFFAFKTAQKMYKNLCHHRTYLYSLWRPACGRACAKVDFHDPTNTSLWHDRHSRTPWQRRCSTPVWTGPAFPSSATKKFTWAYPKIGPNPKGCRLIGTRW